MKAVKMLMAVLLLCVLAQAAQAYVIEIAFEGVIDEISNLPADWVDGVVVGATFTGCYCV